MEVSGEEILDPEYDRIVPFFCGTTFAKDKDDWVLIDQEGNEIKIETDIESLEGSPLSASLLGLDDMSTTMNSDYFNPSDIANLVSLKDFMNANTASKALTFANVGEKSYFLTPGTHNSKGGSFNYDYGTKKYKQDLVYRSSRSYRSELYQYDYTMDEPEDAWDGMVEATEEAMGEALDVEEAYDDYDSERVPDYAFPEYEYDDIPFGPQNLRSINYQVKCSDAMAETEEKTVYVSRSSIEELSRNEQQIYLRKKQNAVIEKLGYLKPTEAKVTRQELDFDLTNSGQGKAYYLAVMLGEKMKNLSKAKPDEIEEENNEDRRTYSLTISNETFKEFRLRCTDSRVAIVLKPR